MTTSNCTNGIDSVENPQTYLPGTRPPPGLVSLVQRSVQSASTQDAASTAAPAGPSPFPHDASLAIDVDITTASDIGSIDSIKVVPTLLTRPPLKDITSYTSDSTEILRFEAGQLVFRTRLALALAKDMAKRTPCTDQQNFKTEIDAVTQSMMQTLKLVNDLSVNIGVISSSLLECQPSHRGPVKARQLGGLMPSC